MEGDSGNSKRNQRHKRRERVQVQQEKQTNRMDESGGESEEAPPLPRSSAKEKGKNKPRRRRRSSDAATEDDIIDGFAITSFKTLEDLEVGYDRMYTPHDVVCVLKFARYHTKNYMRYWLRVEGWLVIIARYWYVV